MSQIDDMYYALHEILENAESGAWTLPSSFAACARAAINRYDDAFLPRQQGDASCSLCGADTRMANCRACQGMK